MDICFDADVGGQTTRTSDDATSSAATNVIGPEIPDSPPRVAQFAIPGTDSGYATEAPSPDLPKCPSSEHDPVYSLPSRKGLFQHKVKLKPFDVYASDEVRNRFRDVVKFVDRPLYDYLRKEGFRPGPVSITLKYLGEDEARASPWIVVLCEKGLSKKVRQWFNTKAVRSHYAPDTPSPPIRFEVLVHERPPQLLSAPVYGAVVGCQNWYIPGLTLCGRVIRVGDPNLGQLATLGGLLKISWGPETAFYGLTVNHVFTEQQVGRQDSYAAKDTGPSNSSLLVDTTAISDRLDEEAEDLYDEEDIFELDTGSDNDVTNYNNSTDLEAVRYDTAWARIGSAFQTLARHQYETSTYPRHFSDKGWVSSLNHNGLRTLDWNLVEIDDTTKLWSNRLYTPGAKLDLRLGSDRGCKSGLGRKVWVSSGLSGLVSGTISEVPVFLTLEYDLPLTETYGLDITEGQALQPGDCGSWVADQISGEVYGHVVAIDVFDTVYVVPFGGILNDIKNSTAGGSVDLPTHGDLKAYWKTMPKQDDDYLKPTSIDHSSIRSPPLTPRSLRPLTLCEQMNRISTLSWSSLSSFSTSVDFDLDFELNLDETQQPERAIGETGELNDSGYSSMVPSPLVSPMLISDTTRRLDSSGLRYSVLPKPFSILGLARDKFARQSHWTSQR